jgi:hypothetical protein
MLMIFQSNCFLHLPDRRIVTLLLFYPEDGGRRLLQNVGNVRTSNMAKLTVSLS